MGGGPFNGVARWLPKPVGFLWTAFQVIAECAHSASVSGCFLNGSQRKEGERVLEMIIRCVLTFGACFFAGIAAASGQKRWRVGMIACIAAQVAFELLKS